jgi:hypothetical protein
LSRIPSLFGRLDEHTNQVLTGTHADLFREWLYYPLEIQVEDLRAYLSQRLEVEWELVLLAYAGIYDRLLPAAAMRAEQELFASDLQISLRLAMGRAPDSY